MLGLQSLKRRRERLIIIHVWKLLSNKVPNDISMEFYYNDRLGWKTKLPKLYGRANASSGVIGAKLCNLLPKDINTHIKFSFYDNKFIRKIQFLNFWVLPQKFLTSGNEKSEMSNLKILDKKVTFLIGYNHARVLKITFIMYFRAEIRLKQNFSRYTAQKS